MNPLPSSQLPAPGFGAAQRAWLAALGLVPLQRRADFLPEAVADEALQPSVSGSEPTAPRLRIFAGGVADPFAGAQAKLLRAVLAALGLSAEEITFELEAALPLLAFGQCKETDAFRVAALDSLRDPIGKRVAWKELRRLRRTLVERAWTGSTQ